MEKTQEKNPENYRLPSNATLQHATKIAIVEDKPVMLDYWTESLDKNVILGIREEGEKTEKLLIKNEQEYTSPIARIYKVENEFIIMTENSIYLVSSDISKRRVS
jgi:FlaA1/EpsC-like NDP-sugar epimerase